MFLGAQGSPTSPSDTVADPLCGLCPPVPLQHLLSRFIAASADAALEALLATGSPRDRARLRSASGLNAGKLYTADLSVTGVALTDRQWSYGARFRLGLATAPVDFTCGNLTLADAPCGEPLDRFGDHAAGCNVGPWRNFRHSSLCDTWSDIFDELGAYVRREALVPEMCTSVDAVLDIWAFGITELPDLLADVTVRHPTTDLFMPTASEITGYAAGRGEAAKASRYPPAGGRVVLALAHETYGRLGPAAEDLLLRCVAVAARKAHREGRGPDRNLLKTWRARLDASLVRGLATQLHQAHAGTPGERCYRQRGSCLLYTSDAADE